MSNLVFFFSEDLDFKLNNEELVSSWIKLIISSESYRLESINYVFCSDAYLLKINKEYLQHDFLTDIITFPLSDSNEETIEADIFISIDRVKENAQTLNISMENELHRVMAHGVLHLTGYGDSNDSEKALMRKKEDAYLSLRDF